MAKSSVPRTTRRATLQETANLYQLRHGQTPSRPALHLQGHWLAHAGFQANSTVTIKVDRQRLVIEAPDAPSPHLDNADRLARIHTAYTTLQNALSHAGARATASDRERLYVDFAYTVLEVLSHD